MTTYAGFDVLDATIQNRTGQEPFKFARKMVMLDNKTGPRGGYAASDAPRTSQPFRWFCESRSQIMVLKAFLAARRGRAVPFWLPSYHQDLTLAQNLPNGAVGATIVQVGYANQFFPAGGARRHVAIYAPGAAPAMYRKIIAATDPGNQLTESITFDAAVAGNWTPAGTVMSFLHFCRLADDVAAIDWHTQDCAEAELALIDLPREAPV